MSDSSKFINSYIENSMSMIHEYVALVLQLRAQVKVTEDLVAEKEQYIQVLLKDVENAKAELNNNRTEYGQLNEKINEIRGLKQQLEHMNTFVNQVNDMKKMLKDKDREIDKLKGKSEPKALKPAPKRDINKKESDKPLVDDKSEEQADDF